MKAISFFARALWGLSLALVAGQDAWAVDGCRAADFNGDGVVNQIDVAILLPLLGLPAPREDLDGDGVVGDADVAIVEGFSGTICPSCATDLSGNDRVCAEDRQILEDAYDVDCRPDLNRDGWVDELDSAVLDAYVGGPLSRAAERADFNQDAVVDDSDRSLLQASFGADCRPDFNGDGAVDVRDLGPLFATWGACPAEPSDDARGEPKPTCDEGGDPPPPQS